MSHPVITGLHSEAAATRRAACDAAVDDPSAVLLVEALVGALGDRDPGVARAATRSLERIGREHDAVLVALRAALRGESARQRLEAAWTWARLEPPPLKLLPAVVSTLGELEGDARWRAARLLVELGRLHDEVLPVVAGLAEPEAGARTRRIALAALRELAPHDARTRELHLAASRDSDLGLQRLALTGLAGLGDATPEVWERLGEVLREHPDPACRRVAATAAAALGDPPAALREALESAARTSRDDSLRAAARRALSALEASSAG